MSIESLKDKTVIAMSGGVDSSVSALLLKQQNIDAVGVSMQVWDYRNNGGCDSKATCCSPDDFTDARLVASKIGIPYYVFDFEKVFKKEVIDKFISTYQEGETPNPCVDCNNKVKFLELRNRAKSFGCKNVATGHFARVKETDQGFHLLRGVDSLKDQSYFLYGIKQDELSETIFPVGEMTKEEVREKAREFGLNTAEKAESQDICFVSGSLNNFLVKIGGIKNREGFVVDKDGKVLKSHEGIQNFTIGQRRGIGLGGTTEPYYVTDIQKESNTIVVGPKKDLETEGFIIKDLNIVSPSLINKLKDNSNFEIDCIAQLRHRHSGEKVKVVFENGIATVKFLNSWAVVSPGQAGVLYDLDNNEVLAGGRIDK